MDFLLHYFQIIILGIVEGVTEFLPISSTGHLLIAEHLLGASEPDVFNVVIQAGAIMAVVFIYWRKIVELVTHLELAEDRNYLLKIAGAFIVTSVISLILIKKFHLKLPETLTPVAWATLIGGLVIFAIEFVSKNLYQHDDISWPEAIMIGAAQVLAGIFPGTSRSGATIMTGLLMGMKRPAATEFSFLLGIPTMFAASGLDLWRARKDLTTGGHQLIIDIILGFIVSAIVAFFVVKWLLRFVQSHTFNSFAIYRVILGIVLLVTLATHALPEVGKEETATQSQAAPAPIEPVPTPTPVPTPAPVVTAPAQPDVPVPAVTTPAPLRALPVNPADLTNADSAPQPSSSAPPANVPTPQN